MAPPLTVWCPPGITTTDLFVVPALLALMIATSIVDLLMGGHLHDSLGIQPRTLAGLPGIFCAPFLHMSYAHLAGNMAPLAVMSVLLLLRLAANHTPAWRAFVGLCGTMALSGNIAVWLVARPNSNHAGASGLVFSLAGLLLGSGVFAAFSMGWPPQCSLSAALSVACTGLTFALYGGLLWGLAPTTWIAEWGVSWEGHTAGFVTGVLAAWVLVRHENGRLPSWVSRAVFGSGALLIGATPPLPVAQSVRYGTVS